MRAKDKVLARMQQFKRATPPRLVHAEEGASAESAVQPAETRGKIRSAPGALYARALLEITTSARVDGTRRKRRGVARVAL